MRKLLLLLLTVVLFSSHDMFLRLDGYFLEPATDAKIQLFNGTFDKSENVITRDRMTDVSIVANGTRTQVDTTQWQDADGITVLDFTTGAAGTYVAGVSTKPRDFAQTAKAFNDYLAHDGVLDVLEWRKENDALEEAVVERYSKHVKTIFQVGEELTDDWKAELGYPIEFIPASNPYALHAGENLQVQLLWQGEPLANQLVYLASADTGHGHSHDGEADHEHDHEHDGEAEHDHDAEAEHEHGHDHDGDAGHTHSEEEKVSAEASHTHDAQQLRTDASGNVTITPDSEGTWYLQTIYLVPSEEEGLTHESNWATLTFAVGHGHSHADGGHTHSHADGDHSHEHAHEEGLPSYVYWLASLLLVGGLFFWFNRKQ